MPPLSENSGLFAPRAPDTTRTSALPWLVAGAVLLMVAALVFFATRHHPAPANTVQPLAPYAASLAVTDLAMSESASLSGAKVTYLDGHIRNTGSQTVTAATVQVLFANDETLPPQLETLPLTLIRTHEPYVDTQPVSAAPLHPGDQREFRLIFENINTNWNGQMPVVHITDVTTQ